MWLSRKNLPHEIWRDAVGYAGHYQISNYGRTKSLKRGRQEILRAVKNPAGYSIVVLFKNNARKNFRIHQLVAQAFIENPDAKPEVHHRNPFAKLTAEEVRYIRRVYIPRHPNFGATALAEKFHMDRHVLYDAIHYRTYKNIR